MEGTRGRMSNLLEWDAVVEVKAVDVDERPVRGRGWRQMSVAPARLFRSADSIGPSPQGNRKNRCEK